MRKFIFPLLFLLIITGLLCKIINLKNRNNEIISHFSSIDFDDFDFLQPIHDYELNENSVICFFSSTCSLCSYEAELLKKEQFTPENLDFIWVSCQPKDSIESFIEKNNLSDVAHFKFARIDSVVLEQKYDVREYPKGLVYKNGRLCHVYKGLICLHKIKEKIRTFE